MENFSVEKLIKNKEPQSRLLEAMLPVSKEPSKVGGSKDTIIYDMYRGIKTLDDLRYDITVFYPEMLGDEYMKTFGHYHKGLDMEISEVLEGNVWYFLQKYKNEPETIEEVYLVEAKKGEKIVSPTGFGHTTINYTQNKAICSNWINTKSESDYAPLKKLRGTCYYFSKNGQEKNENYEKIPELVRIRPKEVPEFGITFDKPLIDYSSKELDFLTNPEKYKNILTIENCYTRT